MTPKVTHLDFSGQPVFVGMDISKKSWKICIYVGPHFHRSFAQPPSPDTLIKYLRVNFPGGDYLCVYEAGYFGFWIHEALQRSGVRCIVVNPADVPTAHWEKTRKTDPVDANKLARSLATGSDFELRPIYVPDRLALEDRALVRTRNALVSHQTRCKNRVKAFLQYYGIFVPGDICDQHWSRRYLGWLEQVRMQHLSGNTAFQFLLRDLLAIRENIAQITRQIRRLALEDRYRRRVELLRTVPGISELSAMIILTELIDIHRFKSLNTLASYTGLIPSEHSSGERQIETGMTYRRNTALRYVVIESAWTAIRLDPVLMLCFCRLSATMPKSKAIVKIARKLLNRIRFVLLHLQPYQINSMQAA